MQSNSSLGTNFPQSFTKGLASQITIIKYKRHIFKVINTLSLTILDCIVHIYKADKLLYNCTKEYEKKINTKQTKSKETKLLEQ